MIQTKTADPEIVEAARREIARRELARRKTVYRLKYLIPGYIIKPVHSYVGAALDRWLADYRAGHAPRLMIDMPPQHGKSTLANGALMDIAGTVDHAHIVITSYGADLAERSSIEIFNWLTSQEGRNIYPGAMDLRRSKQKMAASEWQTARGTVVLARGVGGALTGRPADVILFDDLVKDYEEYISRAIRRRLRSWIETVAGTRINNETAILSISTRWGVDDGADLIEQIIPGDWQRISIPVLAEQEDPLGREPGEPLFPEKHSRARLLETKERIGELKWAAMYQQTPLSQADVFFKHDKWSIEETSPYELRWLRYWDLGFTRDGHATAGALVSINSSTKDIWIKDIQRIDSLDWPEIKLRIKAQAIIDGPDVILSGEGTGTQIGYWMELERELAQSGILVQYRTSKPSKEDDARRWQSRQWAGMVHLVRGDWVSGFIESARAFPGRDVDEIDAISGAVTMLEVDKIVGGLYDKSEVAVAPDPWDEV